MPLWGFKGAASNGIAVKHFYNGAANQLSLVAHDC